MAHHRRFSDPGHIAATSQFIRFNTQASGVQTTRVKSRVSFCRKRIRRGLARNRAIVNRIRQIRFPASTSRSSCHHRNRLPIQANSIVRRLFNIVVSFYGRTTVIRTRREEVKSSSYRGFHLPKFFFFFIIIISTENKQNCSLIGIFKLSRFDCT